MREENKELILAYLKLMLQNTRAGSCIKDMTLENDKTEVLIVFDGGGNRRVNIKADSGIAMIKDVIAHI